MNPSTTVTDARMRFDRRMALAGIGVVLVLSWAYLLKMVWDMSSMDMGAMAMGKMGPTWDATYVVWLFWMWSVMMIAMMLPSATPMIATFTTINRKQAEQQGVSKPLVSTFYFGLGYLLMWVVFSLVATLAQWALHEAALLSPMMASTSPIFGGVLLIATGLFQWTPLKHACLRHCRSPIGFIMTEYRSGNRGALVMGLKHGTYCVACCWFLMALLFFGGVMNLLWIAGLAGYVLLEKIVPHGIWVGRIVGLGLTLWGLFIIWPAVFA